MKKIYWLLLLCGFASLHTQAQIKKLSPNAKIYVMTIAAGEELYSAFGHTAIWVTDPATVTDIVYNYGTFDFEPPQFYIDFSLGKLFYRLDTETYRYFKRVYRYYQRSYSGQLLRLTPSQTQQMYEFMEYNYLPENRYYLYDFLYDNCATRVQDMLTYVLKDSIEWGDLEAESDMSFRDMLDSYLENRPWPDFGISLALGSVVDRKAKYRERDFLPDYLAMELGKAQVLDTNGQYVPLVANEVPFYEGIEVVEGPPFWLRPIAIVSLLAMISLFFSYREFTRKKVNFRLNKIIFFIVGLMGFVLAFLWLGTEHSVPAWNYNLLWLWPTHIILAWFIRANAPQWVWYYYLASGVTVSMVLLGFAFMPQDFHIAFIPMMIIISSRSLGLFFQMRAS